MKKSIFILFVLITQSIFAQTTNVSQSYDKIGKYINGVAFVHKNGLVGFIDMQGKEIVKPEYDKIAYFGSDNLAFTHKNKLVGLIDIKGKVLIPPTYDRIGGFRGGQAFVVKNGLTGVIDVTGRVLIEPIYTKMKQGAGRGSFIATNPDGSEVVLTPSVK